MKYYHIPVAALLLSAAACTKEIKVDIPEHRQGLVVSSNTIANDTFRVQVGKSTGILKYKHNLDLSVSNATVVLMTNGTASETLTYDPHTGLYNSAVVAEPGKTYSLKVSAPGFNTAEASSEVSQTVAITSVQRISKVRLDFDGNQQDEIRIQFNDPAAAGDYYIVSIVPPPFMEDTFKNGNSIGGCVNTTDASVESIYNESIDQNTCLSPEAIFLRDALFNGSTKELRLFVSSQSLMPVTNMAGDTVYPSIELHHVPEAYFRYLKSYQFASENVGNPFAEPTNVYSNVKNGYGVFSIISADSKEIR